MTALGDDATVPKILMPSDGIRVGKGLNGCMLRKIPGEVFSVPGPGFRSRVSLRPQSQLSRPVRSRMQSAVPVTVKVGNLGFPSIWSRESASAARYTG